MIKAIFFDLDGTLVSGTVGTYTPAVKAAFDALREKGILLFAATGRSTNELKITGMVDGLHFDGIVALNGQYCYNDKEVFYSHLFDKDDLARLIARSAEVPFPCMLVEKEEMYINYIDDHVRYALHCIHTPPPPVRDLRDSLHKDVLMAMAYLPAEETQEKVLSVLQNSAATRWNKYGIDILPLGCSKRTGIEKVLERYGIRWDEVMTFGDGENDLPMLRAAKIGVAMGNSPDFMLTGEFYVTDTVENDGAVSALKHFGLL